MGIPIPPADDYEVGMPCRRCDDALWKPDKTPLFVNVVFTGMIPCFAWPPEPPNGVIFTLIQTHACTWHAYGVYPYFWEITWNLMSGASGLFLSGYIPGWGREYFFSGWEPIECLASFTNTLKCPSNGAEGGSGHVSWGPPIEVHEATTIAYDYGFHPHGKNLIHYGTCEDANKFIRLASKLDKTNILIKYDPDIVPP